MTEQERASFDKTMDEALTPLAERLAAFKATTYALPLSVREASTSELEIADAGGYFICSFSGMETDRALADYLVAAANSAALAPALSLVQETPAAELSDLALVFLTHLEAKATPAPWEVVTKGNTVKSHAIPGVCSGISPKTSNGPFISLMRNVLPGLLAENARLRAATPTPVATSAPTQGDLYMLRMDLMAAHLNATTADTNYECACILKAHNQKAIDKLSTMLSATPVATAETGADPLEPQWVRLDKRAPSSGRIVKVAYIDKAAPQKLQERMAYLSGTKWTWIYAEGPVSRSIKVLYWLEEVQTKPCKPLEELAIYATPTLPKKGATHAS